MDRNSIRAEKSGLASSGDRNKVPFAELGVVESVEEDGRIIARLASGISTGILYRILPWRGLDGIYPEVGQTVTCHFLDGDAHTGFYSGIVSNAKSEIPLPPMMGRKDSSVWIDSDDTIHLRSLTRIVLEVGVNRLEITAAGIRMGLAGTKGINIGADGVIRIEENAIAVVGATDSDGDTVITSGQDVG